MAIITDGMIAIIERQDTETLHAMFDVAVERCDEIAAQTPKDAMPIARIKYSAAAQAAIELRKECERQIIRARDD